MKSINIITEAVKKIKTKDRLAMNLLYTRYVKEMLTFSYRITNNMDDAEDVIQESFLSSFLKINQLKDPNHYSYWLKRIVLNNSLKVVKNKVYFKPIEEEDFEDVQDNEKWYENIQFETINKTIQSLPNGCREILTLYLLDGFKHKEIAEVFKISVSTSKSQYRYALKLLKKQLRKEL